MGLLIDGQWHDQWYDTKKSGGTFVRSDAQFRNWVTVDDDADFKPESGRYHLYVSYACPWAHRTLIVRTLKGLADHISVSVVSYDMLENGWTFDETTGSTGDALFGAHFMFEIYTRAQADYSGRVTVPVLWDTQTNTIVSNESSEIIRMFNTAFNDLPGVNADLDLYPENLRADIDEINARVYDTVNNGVYKAGFATQQDAYEGAITALFESLNWLEDILSDRLHLVGDNVTEADWRLFTTLIRFDAVYHGHFKCNLRTLESYPNLASYVRALYQHPGVGETVHFDHIKKHYYRSQTSINPTQIVPTGPVINFTTPHGRDPIASVA